MNPATLLRSFTPSSTAFPSATDGLAGPAVGAQIVHGQVPPPPPPPPIVTVTPAEGDSTNPLSSDARLRIVAVPLVGGVHVQVHDVVPAARCQLRPPSTETSTTDTMPPPTSCAVPAIVTALPA